MPFYKDNYHNRKVKRVGQAYGKSLKVTPELVIKKKRSPSPSVSTGVISVTIL